jgi:hypothetical protein
MAHSQHWRGGWAGAIVALACGLWGCSVHPLPDDVAKASTVDIVERIRCEVQEGLLRFASTDAHARKIIEGTTIGLEFDFVMHEVNSTTAGSMEFERPAGGGGGGTKFELEVNAAASSKRENKRVFRTLEDLKQIEAAECAGDPVRSNRRHPITGATGMAEIVRTYIRLEKLTDLARGGDDAVFSDDIDFTTEYDVGVLPNLTVDTVAGSFRLKRASVLGSIGRKDVHSVTVALARDAKHEDVDPKRMPKLALRRTSAREARRELIEADVAQSTRSLRALGRTNADARNRVLLELQRRRNVREDAKVVARVLGTN